MGHLVTEDRELVHGHLAQVLAVNALVADQACGRDHAGGHTITNEENHVLSLLLLGEVADNPVGNSLGAIVVAQSGGILARLVERNAAVGLGCDIDNGWCLRVLSEVVLVPLELPLLNLWLGDIEELGYLLRASASLLDGKRESLIRNTTVGCIIRNTTVGCITFASAWLVWN